MKKFLPFVVVTIIFSSQIVILALIKKIDILDKGSEVIIEKREEVNNENKELSSKKININTANKEILDSLPGIGVISAEKIIKNRPYSSIDQLSNAGLTKNQIEKIRELISVE